MIGVIYGTTGELIKLAPVLHELDSRGISPLMLCTGQQAQQVPAFQRDLHLPDVTVWLRAAERGDLDRKSQIPGWTVEVMSTIVRKRRTLRRALMADGRRPMLLVHGDTMTTVLGALAARILRIPVGHIEAGMRSGDWRNPFPEELNRRVAAKLVNVHYAPGAQAVANLEREHVKGAIVDTRQNTIRDALTLAIDATEDAGVELPREPFGLVSIHRFELIEREQLLRPLLEVLHEHSRRQPMLFVDHSTTKAVIDADRTLRELFDERFRRIPRQPYLQFIALLRRADFLVSDSGGSQEECAMLGLPCLIHRAVSEHETGIGTTVVLSGLDLERVRTFLADPSPWRTGIQSVSLGPSKVIVDDIASRGALG
jgi:UDP-N-acetylglucosamine 2-epimerase (non-hydrolysing)